MDLGPLEYVVIGIGKDEFKHEVLPQLLKVQAGECLRIVDLLFVNKGRDGVTTTREVSGLEAEELSLYEDLVDDLMGWLTAEDIRRLSEAVPHNTQAVVILLEHTWALELSGAVGKAGGVFLSGGLVPPAILKQVSAELAEKEKSNA